jgi:hypothetical protein
MSDETLKVDTPTLATVGTAFGDAAAALAGLAADAPLGDAAGALPQSKTAAACRTAQAQIAAATTTVSTAARTYSDNLHTAMAQYESRDAAGADAVRGAR